MSAKTHRKTFRRAVLGTCSGVHMEHDGFSNALYLLLPVWQAEFALSLTQVGSLKALYSGTITLLQIPAGLLAERWGERALLGMGTVITGLAYLTLGTAGGYEALLAMLLVGGAGTAVQHPLASSVVSKTYDQGSRRVALGIYNFSGDIGKAVISLAASVIIGSLGWRWGTTCAGILGVAAGIIVYLVLRRLGVGAPPDINRVGRPATAGSGGKDVETGWGITNWFGFNALSAIGILDSAGRTGFLTFLPFLPFLLIGKGTELETVGMALALVYGGGAAGKFICGFLSQRLGIILTMVLTEMITGLGILALLVLPLNAALMLLPLIGLGLNGTSSVLYGTVSEFVTEYHQARGFGLFYTLSMGGSTVAPVGLGLLSDSSGVVVTLSAVAVLALTTIPLCALLVRPLGQLKHPLG
jgi:FSR family fosmidomycin resistance protein-like MFS transporter